MFADGPAVLADANALYSPAVCDILLELMNSGLIKVYWSQRVLDELDRAIVRSRPYANRDRSETRSEAMSRFFPDLMVVPSGRVLRARLPDTGDEHVLAAALDAPCSTILTFNLRHFPHDLLVLEDPELTALHPDQFLAEFMSNDTRKFLEAVETVRLRLVRPPMTREQHFAGLRKAGLKTTADLLLKAWEV